MIQAFHAVPILTAVMAVPVSVINGFVPADVATELQNDLEWILNNY